MVKGVKFLSRLLNASCSVVITVPLFFSSPTPHQSYNPRHPPLGTFENQDVAATVRRGISKRSHEKIGDCEQSNKSAIVVLLEPESRFMFV